MQKTPSPPNPIELYFNKIRFYQFLFFFILFLCQVPAYWHFLSIIFLSPPMTFYCNKTIVIKNYCPCDDPWWDRSIFTETIQTKFNLSCDRNWLVSFTHSVLYLGTVLGAMCFGIISDKFGRRLTCVVSILLLACSGCLSAVMPNVTAFIFLRCLEGLSAGGFVVASFVFIVEHCGPNNREVVSGLYHISLNIGHITLAGVSYLLRNFVYFQLTLSAPLFMFMILMTLKESPKWLMDHGRIDDAVQAMENISKFNRKPRLTFRTEIEEYNASRSHNRKKIYFYEIFTHRKPLINLSCTSVIFFVCGMGFYGVSQFIGKMSGEIHKNVALSGTLLIPATLVSVFLLRVLRRRVLLMITTLLSGIFMLTVIFIPTDLSLLRVFSACVCNCFFFMSFIVAFLFGVELFPTAIRSSALGFLSLMSRLGQIAAPQINELPEFVSGLIFGSFAIIGTILCCPLPETKNKNLPSTLDDVAITSLRLKLFNKKRREDGPSNCK